MFYRVLTALWKLGVHLQKLSQRQLPVLSGPERVQFTRAAHGDDQQQSTDEAAHRCRGDDLAGQHDCAAELVRAVFTVHLAVTAPALINTTTMGTMGRLLLKNAGARDSASRENTSTDSEP